MNGRDVTVISISFNESVVEITYTESREATDNIAMVKTLVLNDARYRENVAYIMDEAEEIIDDALLQLRNPADKIDRRQRRQERKRELYGDEEEDGE